jgi:cob(I)alamin adenosyltransferase
VKIYTRSGDRGDTGLLDGRRVPKADPRIEACGEVDELNAALGLVLASGIDADIAEMANAIQRDLLALGGRLADPSHTIATRTSKAALGEPDVKRLEGWIDQLENELPPLHRFLLPGGSPAGATLHLARTACRRAERRIVALGPDGVEPVLLAYINRLSDLLFVMARVVNRRAGEIESEW